MTTTLSSSTTPSTDATATSPTTQSLGEDSLNESPSSSTTTTTTSTTTEEATTSTTVTTTLSSSKTPTTDFAATSTTTESLEEGWVDELSSSSTTTSTTSTTTEVPALAEAEVEARRALLKGIKQRKRDAARKAIEAMDEGAVKRWAKPRALQEWFDAEQAMDYFVGPATGDGDRREGSANHHREEANHGPYFEMEMETFRRLLAVTPKGRAPGDDECAYEHVRYAVESSSNFRGEIWEVMKASVQLGVFPRAFKPVRLVLIPKPSKGVDQGNGLAENPWKRWRPISLLRVLGKVLEKGADTEEVRVERRQGLGKEE
ncbi:merozoite surface antigen 2, putative [Perkinsus marinus ATCC 50983]|uniref:Merozoite surface antigen 2, putative n=1 Tax=Perkinsus marinus (strain ATCC 50983 / TXsc) TaxID=423536 RepID=C5LYW8_PERM5|nr:merozoite surface antigen 2, putative [Perkinsus marinus ATCC 50983]EEQ97977.1 merozoite surface antigen 2, putative [Perkinsus marinus ATCC 50983]|eukprot:XP_002765260.1 merozoite surface antigen 2, putative [Perkinsus marinus ATCC 50983]